MALQLQNFQTMLQNMAASTKGACNSLVNFTVGSTLRAIHEAGASVGLWLQYLILTVLNGTRLATSTGSQCDSFGADFNFARLPATQATGSVTFSRFVPTAAALIAAGQQVRTADGTQTFTVTAQTSNSFWNAAMNGYLIPAGTASVTVPVTAVNYGTQGNVLAGAINLIVGAISGVDTVINASALAGAVAAESDAAFKLRFSNYIQTRAQCTLAAITYAIQSIQQGVSCSITELINAGMVYTPGSFVAYIDDGSGNPPSSTIQTASTAVNLSRACGIQYAVQGPSLITANITATVTTNGTVIWATVQGAVESAVAAWIDGLAMGQPLPYTKLAQQIYAANAGITNVTALLVNGGTADLGGAANQVVRAGTITLS